MSDWHQGSIHYADLAVPLKNRPVVIISRTDINQMRENVVVALITRTIRNNDLEISVGEEEGLTKPSVITLGDIHTVKKNRLGDRKGNLSDEKILQMKQNLKLLFEIE